MGASPARVLLVEDRESLRGMLTRALESAGCTVVASATGSDGIDRLRGETFDLVLTDLRLPGASGLEVLAASREARSETPVVVLTAYGTVAAAVEAMKRGAADFLEKPVDVDDLLRLVEELTGEERSEEAFTAPGGTVIVGSAPALRRALRLLRRVAATESTLLLTGDSGTGKELFARAAHELSPRAGGPFVAVNCAAIPRDLVENELFGHEKGAFTGAHRRQKGRFEQAAGGTLLLDEVGDLDLSIQAKVLRVLEERRFERVGGEESLTADVRLVAATNRDLASMVEEGAFRPDLYYRLEVFPIELPRLAERREDVPALARHLLEKLAEREGRACPRLDPGAREALASADWPGNVRQLANVLERAFVVLEGERWTRADLEPLMGAMTPDSDERRVRDALERSDGDKARAAEILGVSRRTLQRRIRDLDLEGFPRYRS